MAERSVKIVVKAEDRFSDVLRKYQTAMGQSEQATRKMGQASDETASTMNNFTKAFDGLVAGFTVGAVINFAEEFNLLGSTVNQTGQRFDALSDSMGMSADLMNKLRGATLGIADDLEIQSGAVRLMQMGLVDTDEDLEKLMATVVRLKQPTESFGEAIENVSLMISNMSYLRLDSLGISSAAVRTEVARLRAEFPELSKEAAFARAMMDEAAKGIDKLGPAAESSSTAVGRLQTDLENFHQFWASRFNTGVEGTLGLIEIAAGQHPEQRRQAQEEMQRLADDYAVAVGYLNDQANLKGMDESFVSTYVRAAIKAAQDDPTLMNDATALRDKVLSQEFQIAYPEMAFGEGGGLADVASLQQLNTITQIAQQSVYLNQLHREEDAIFAQEAETLAKIEDANTRINSLYATAGGFLQDGLTTLQNWQMRYEDLTFTQETFSAVLGDISAEAEALQSNFMTEEQAARSNELADNAAMIYEQMLELAETDPFLFTEEQMDSAKETADHVGKLADNADRAVNSLNNIKLSEIFGLGNRSEIDSLLSQIGPLVSNNIEDPEARAAFEREYKLLSNQTSTGQIALEDEIAPLIASIEDEELQAKASQIVATLMSEAWQRGIDINSDEFWGLVADNLGVTPGAPGMGFEVRPGDTVSGLAGQYGMTPDEIMAATGITNPLLLQPGAYNLPGAEVDASAIENFDPDAFFADFETLSGHATTLKSDINTFWADITASQDPTAAVEASVGNISTFADNIAARFKELTAKVQVVRVKIETEITGDGGQWIAEQVRAAGGVVPGAIGPQ